MGLPVIHPTCILREIKTNGDKLEWVELGYTLDTPKHIRTLMDEYCSLACWVFTLTGRRYVFRKDL